MWVYHIPTLTHHLSCQSLKWFLINPSCYTWHRHNTCESCKSLICRNLLPLTFLHKWLWKLLLFWMLHKEHYDNYQYKHRKRLISQLIIFFFFHSNNRAVLSSLIFPSVSLLLIWIILLELFLISRICIDLYRSVNVGYTLIFLLSSVSLPRDVFSKLQSMDLFLCLYWL